MMASPEEDYKETYVMIVAGKNKNQYYMVRPIYSLSSAPLFLEKLNIR